MSKASRESAEIKKAIIRKDIFALMQRCVSERLSSEKATFIMNAHIEGMKRRNRQESHLVTSVCIEIRTNVDEFCRKQFELIAKGKTE